MLKKINIILMIITIILSTFIPSFASDEITPTATDNPIMTVESLEGAPPQMDSSKNQINSDFIKEIPLSQEKLGIKSNKRLTTTATATTSASAINIDANHAELITKFATAINGSIDVPAEKKWYALSTAVDMKISVKVSMASTADFDLYMYKLNEEKMVLEYIGNSTNAKGADEYISRVAQKGIYYFMINNYEGSGSYALTAYGSNQDMSMETNDSLATAFAINNLNTAWSGVIDNPKDIDWYKFNVTGYMSIDIDFTVPSGSNYNLYYSDGKSIYQFNLSKTLRLSNPGAYYFIVVSADGSYANTNPYQIKCKAINKSHYVHTDDWSAVFEKDTVGNYYVNGNIIDLSYDFHNTVTNSAGTINTYMVLYPGSSPQIASDDWFGFADYTTDFFGSVSKKKILVLTLTNITSAKIDRYASGAYSDSAHYQTNYARIVIDPDTGKILDMLDPNYYYDYGNQSYKITPNYTNVY